MENPVKKYPLSKYPIPPKEPPTGYQWVKVADWVTRRITVPAEYAYYQKRVKPVRKRGKIIRRGYYRFYRYTVEKARKYTREYKKYYWLLEKQVVKPRKERWVNTVFYIDDFLKQFRNKKKYEILMEAKFPEKTAVQGGKVYLLTKYYTELNTKFHYWEKKLPLGDKFVFYSVYYFIEVTGYKNKTKIIFRKSSFKDLKTPLDVFQLASHVKNIRIPELKERLKTDHTKFLWHAFFAGTTAEEYETGRGRYIKYLSMRHKPQKARILLKD